MKKIYFQKKKNLAVLQTYVKPKEKYVQIKGSNREVEIVQKNPKRGDLNDEKNKCEM